MMPQRRGEDGGERGVELGVKPILSQAGGRSRLALRAESRGEGGGEKDEREERRGLEGRGRASAAWMGVDGRGRAERGRACARAPPRLVSSSARATPWSRRRVGGRRRRQRCRKRSRHRRACGTPRPRPTAASPRPRPRQATRLPAHPHAESARGAPPRRRRRRRAHRGRRRGRPRATRRACAPSSKVGEGGRKRSGRRASVSLSTLARSRLACGPSGEMSSCLAGSPMLSLSSAKARRKPTLTSPLKRGRG